MTRAEWALRPLAERLAACRAELARQSAVEQAATKGPWRSGGHSGHASVVQWYDGAEVVIDHPVLAECERWQDGQIIAFARTAFPSLLDVARELLDDAERAMSVVTGLNAVTGGMEAVYEYERTAEKRMAQAETLLFGGAR